MCLSDSDPQTDRKPLPSGWAVRTQQLVCVAVPPQKLSFTASHLHSQLLANTQALSSCLSCTKPAHCFQVKALNVTTQGLAVSLRPYQRQSLKFMLDKEGAEGGFRDLLFCPVSNSQGMTYWYSPVLGRLCADVAPMPQGGILGHFLCSVSAVLCVACSYLVCTCSILIHTCSVWYWAVIGPKLV